MSVDSGIDITHIDTHCGTLFNPKFTNVYIEAGLNYSVPPLLFRPPEKKDNSWQRRLHQLELSGIPLFEEIVLTPLDSMHEKQKRISGIKRILEEIPYGLTYFIIHPAKYEKSLENITPDWKYRVGDYQVFTDPAFFDYIKDSDIIVIGFKKLRDIFRHIIHENKV